MVAINVQNVAVLMDEQAQRGAVVPLDLIEDVVESVPGAELKKSYTGRASAFYVMLIRGSWFDGKGKDL